MVKVKKSGLGKVNHKTLQVLNTMTVIVTTVMTNEEEEEVCALLKQLQLFKINKFFNLSVIL
jgi:hypothetical protein